MEFERPNFKMALATKSTLVVVSKRECMSLKGLPVKRGKVTACTTKSHKHTLTGSCLNRRAPSFATHGSELLRLKDPSTGSRSQGIDQSNRKMTPQNRAVTVQLESHCLNSSR